MPARLREVVRPHATQRVDGPRRLRPQPFERRPTQPGLARMRRRGPDRPEQQVVDPQSLGQHELISVVHGGADAPAGLAVAAGQCGGLRQAQLRSPPMQAHAQLGGQGRVAVHPQPSPGRAASRGELNGEAPPLGGIGEAQVHATQAVGERGIGLSQPSGFGLGPLAWLRRDQHAVGVAQGGDDRPVGGRHRVAVERLRRHPGQGVVLVGEGIALESANRPGVEVQSDRKAIARR